MLVTYGEYIGCAYGFFFQHLSSPKNEQVFKIHTSHNKWSIWPFFFLFVNITFNLVRLVSMLKGFFLIYFNVCIRVGTKSETDAKLTLLLFNNCKSEECFINHYCIISWITFLRCYWKTNIARLNLRYLYGFTSTDFHARRILWDTNNGESTLTVETNR